MSHQDMNEVNSMICEAEQEDEHSLTLYTCMV